MAATQDTAREKLIALADRMRADPSAGTPLHLWRLANEQLDTHHGRVVLLRHAYLHAGLLEDVETGKPYEVCPDCGAALG